MLRLERLSMSNGGLDPSPRPIIAPKSRPVAGGRFDLDDVSTPVGQNSAGRRSGHPHPEFDDPGMPSRGPCHFRKHYFRRNEKCYSQIESRERDDENRTVRSTWTPSPLGRWLDSQDAPGHGEEPPVADDVLKGGSQNMLHRVSRGGLGMVLRMPGPRADERRLSELLREIRPSAR